MQQAPIAHPNKGLVGKNYMGNGKQYRSYAVPNSIPEIEMKNRIYYNAIPNSYIAIYKRDQAMYNKSFSGPTSQMITNTNRDDVMQMLRNDENIEGTEEDRSGSGLFEDGRLRPYALRSLMYTTDYLMPYLSKHHPDIAKQYENSINTREISNAIDFERGRGSGYLYLKKGGASSWSNTWNGIKNLGSTVKNIGSTFSNLAGITSHLTGAVNSITGGISNGITSMKDWWKDRMQSEKSVLSEMMNKVKENNTRSTDYKGWVSYANKYQDEDDFIDKNNKQMINEKREDKITKTADFMHDRENKDAIDYYYKNDHFGSDQLMGNTKLSTLSKEEQNSLKNLFKEKGRIPIDAKTIKQFPSLKEKFMENGKFKDDTPVSIKFSELSAKEQEKYLKNAKSLPLYNGNERLDLANIAHKNVIDTRSGQKFVEKRGEFTKKMEQASNPPVPPTQSPALPDKTTPPAPKKEVAQQPTQNIQPTSVPAVKAQPTTNTTPNPKTQPQKPVTQPVNSLDPNEVEKNKVPTQTQTKRKQEEQPPPTENGGIMQTAYNLGSAVVNGASTVLSLANPFHYFGGANPEYRPKRRRRRRRY